jgi:hypothetical protein
MRSRNLLVEATTNPIIAHTLVRLTRVITSANSYDPIFIRDETTSNRFLDFAKSSISNAKFVSIEKPLLVGLLKTLLFSLKILLLNFSKKKRLKLKYKNYRIGPLAYDSYLIKYGKATLNIFDFRYLKVIALILLELQKTEYIFHKYQIKSVLVSHRVGLSGGSICLVAEQSKIPIYSFGGDVYLSLIENGRQNISEYTPSQKEVEILRNQKVEWKNKYFDIARRKHLGHEINKDSAYAFSGKVWKEKIDFAQNMEFANVNLEIVFILSHVFNDFPNSIFTNEIYCDYFEWLEDTLKICAQNKFINWVVREHPTSSMYFQSEDRFADLAKNFENANIKFIRSDSDFSTESIGNIAKAVITCHGSAGFEFPALFNIPSVHLGDNPATLFNIGTNFNTREDYRNFLKHLGTKTTELPISQEDARLCYVFTQIISRFNYGLNPSSNFAEYKESENDFVYAIEELIAYYETNIKAFAKIEANMIKQLKSPNFNRVVSEEFKELFDVQK